MAQIRNHRDIPPGGWRYVQPETALRFHEDSYDELIARVKAHRVYKGIPIDTVGADVEEQLCLQLSKAWCKPLPGEDYQPVTDLTARLTTDMVNSANRAAKAFLLGGCKFNSKEESAARAKVCHACPFNKPASACSCHSAYRVVEALIPGDRKHEGISVCMACGCSLQAKVNLPLSVVAQSLAPDVVLPPWCWQNEARTLET